MPCPSPRTGFRALAIAVAALAGAGGMAGCAPVQGPYEVQANQAAYACQQGIAAGCYDYQALAPAANAEAYQAQQNAAVGTAVAAGLVGAVAGAAIVGSTRSHHGYYGRGYHGRYRGGYGRGYRGGYHRHYGGYRRY